MKKLLILSVIGIFTLSSFSVKNTESVVKTLYRVKCGNIYYYFECDCSLAAAQGVGHAICSAYGG